MDRTREYPDQQKEARIAELERENEELSRQVKRLVKAESRLYAYQEELDGQLREYKDLYALNRKLSARLDIEGICSVAVQFTTSDLNFERSLILKADCGNGRLKACAQEGYYHEVEKGRVSELVIDLDAPFLSELLERGQLTISPDGEKGEIAPFTSHVGMDEYFIYRLGSRLEPYGLLLFGNRKESIGLYRRVTDDESTLVTIGNAVNVISSSLENYVFYHRIEESEQRYRQLNELLEQRVAEAVSELRRKDRILMVQSRQAVMGEMISNIAHQWRQPLNLLGLLAQEMQMMKEQGELSREFIDRNARKTMETIQRMSGTIEDFRTFFKPDSGRVDFKVSEAIDRTVSLLAGSFEARQIRIEIRKDCEPVIRGYPGEFGQVLVNILINARDALISRNVADPWIVVDLSPEDDGTVLTITDNAGGIPEEYIDRIFDPYFTTKGPEQGTGIGLFMSKTIIEKNMHGVLSVKNTDDGAQFTIRVGGGR